VLKIEPDSGSCWSMIHGFSFVLDRMQVVRRLYILCSIDNTEAMLLAS